MSGIVHTNKTLLNHFTFKLILTRAEMDYKDGKTLAHKQPNSQSTNLRQLIKVRDTSIILLTC